MDNVNDNGDGEESAAVLFSTSCPCYFSYWTEKTTFERKWSRWKYIYFKLYSNGKIVHNRSLQHAPPRHALNQCIVKADQLNVEKALDLQHVFDMSIHKIHVAAHFTEVGEWYSPEVQNVYRI
jgi:hypothetical protein